MNILEAGYIKDNATNYNIAYIKNEKSVNGISSLPIGLKIKIFNGDIVIPVFRLYLLNEDETIRMDISSDFINGSLSVTYQSGQRRTLSATLDNHTHKYSPSLYGLIWTNTKFRLDMGVVYKDTVYWEQQGIFCLKDPSYSRSLSNQTISLSLCDKFGLLDGTVYGRTSLRTIIPTGSSMYYSFCTLLTSDRGNGQPWDLKDIYFNSQYRDQVTFYKIDQNTGTNMSEIFITLSNTISSDVYYNQTGHMCVESNVLEFMNNNFPIIYRFEENDKCLLNASITENWSKVRNKIITKGAIVNGYRFSGTAENRNYKSPYAIQYCGEIPEYIENSNLYADNLCMDNSTYELVKRTRGVKSLNLSCTYLPFLDVNKSVLITYPSLNLYNQNYVIDSYTISIATDAKTSISLTNMTEVMF